MDLILFIFAVLAVGSLIYFLQMVLYFGFTARPVLLALKLSAPLTVVSIVGVVIIGIGGVLMATLIIHGALSKRPNYSQVRDIIASVVMALTGSVGIYFSGTFLAFAILN